MWKQFGNCQILDDVRMHFWEHAYHMWVPTPNFDLNHAIMFTHEPHPIKLPQVFLAGEAFSEHQAWMEGAISTAERVLFAIDQGQRPRTRLPNPSTEVVLDGRILDVSKWKTAHPGGVAAITNHMRDEDLKQLWEHIHSSDRAWAIVLSLQRGWNVKK